MRSDAASEKKNKKPLKLHSIFFRPRWLWAALFLLLWGASAWGAYIYYSGMKRQTLASMRNQAVSETRKSIQQNTSTDFEVGFKAAARLAYQYNKEILLWENRNAAKTTIQNAVDKLSEVDGISFVMVTDMNGKILVQSAPPPDTEMLSLSAPPKGGIPKSIDIDGFPMHILVSVEGKEKEISIICRSESTYAEKPVGHVIVGMTMQLFLPENPHTDKFYQWSLIITPLTLFALFLTGYFLIPKLGKRTGADRKKSDTPTPSPSLPLSASIETQATAVDFGGKPTEEKVRHQAVPNFLSIESENANDGKQELLGPYILVEKIATGGMAELFTAEHMGDDGFRRQVVVKRILPHLVHNVQFVKRFIEEAKLAAFLQHPNVVQITDFGKIEDTYFIVMEYVRGKNLAQILEIIQKGFDLNQVVYIISQICRGLHYSHTKNIIHRDISPQNILISFQGEVKISDFGIARMGAGTGLTTGILGKLNYLSPEQALGKPDEVDQQSDIFSLGILFYEMLTGQNLYKSDNDIELLRMIPQQDVVPVQEVRPDIPDVLAHIVMKCLQRKKADRYGTAREILKDIAPLRYEKKMIYDSDDLSAFMTRLS